MGAVDCRQWQRQHLPSVTGQRTCEQGKSEKDTMAHLAVMAVGVVGLSSSVLGLTTCPGFPGYCSESFPGQVCNVVCEFGRNNVPLCQDDGTWTDIPRCVEHDPGVEEQIPGLCPGIPGYCAIGFLNQRCSFDCVSGADIDSLCTTDGTWAPYPTCEGDLRDTRDGCDGCPGPQGGSRNRTAEALLNQNTISDRRVPKLISGNGARKNIPSFAGNINIGPLGEQSNSNSQQQSRFNSQQAQEQPRFNVQQRFNNQQQQRPNPPQQIVTQRPQQQVPVQRPQQQFNNQQFAGQRPQQQFNNQQFVGQRPQQQFQQPQRAPTFQAGQGQSLFDQIKNRINEGNRQQQGARQSQQQFQVRQQPQSQPRQQPQPLPRQQPQSLPRQQPQPLPRQQPQPRQQFTSQQQGGRTFGVFEAVSLSGGGGPNPPEVNNPRRPQQQAGDNFFGEFQSVNLQA